MSVATASRNTNGFTQTERELSVALEWNEGQGQNGQYKY
jgi:hypothetical protein